MASKSNGSKADVSKATNLVAGAQKNLPTTSRFTILGVAMLVPAIIAKLQGFLTLDLQVAQTYAAWKAAVAAREAALPEAKAFIAAFIAVLRQEFGPGNPILPSFGIPLPKPRRQPTAEQKATAVALAKRTHGKRGPTGKRQRAAITVAGKPGMKLVDPQGNEIPGVTQGPIAPAGGNDAAPGVTAPAAGTQPAAGGSGNSTNG